MSNEVVLMLTSAITLMTVIVSGFINKKAIHEIHVAVNSRLSELLEASKESNLAKGKLEGKREEELQSTKNVDIKTEIDNALKEREKSNVQS